jgi:hypothetical protein
VVMATTTAASPMPGSLETLEETVQIAATLENGSLPSRRRNLEAVFFDLDDTLVLTHAADTVAHKAVQVCMHACMHVCCSTLKLQELWIASPGFS